ncbi:MAG: hypothetical protein HY678_11880 [Chloroflexi bacterium]|nr:hypothetical protein [Chloroflexota bacterium]
MNFEEIAGHIKFPEGTRIAVGAGGARPSFREGWATDDRKMIDKRHVRGLQGSGRQRCVYAAHGRMPSAPTRCHYLMPDLFG